MSIIIKSSIIKSMRGQKTPAILTEVAKQLYPLYQNYEEVGRILNLPGNTVEDLVKRQDNYTELREQQKKLLILEGHKKATELLRAIDPAKAKSLAEVAMTYGIVVDKNAVLAGENNKWSANQVNVGDNRNITINFNNKLKGSLKSASKP